MKNHDYYVSFRAHSDSLNCIVAKCESFGGPGGLEAALEFAQTCRGRIDGPDGESGFTGISWTRAREILSAGNPSEQAESDAPLLPSDSPKPSNGPRA
jgi:hypothetical protein